MSNNCTQYNYEQFLDELKLRYKNVKNGYTYDFKTQIEPFLLLSKNIADCIDNCNLDTRFTYKIKDKVMNTITELAMSVHVERFSKKLFNEMYKYISHWFFYLVERDYT
ncbi:hypothetical protein [Phocicoccus pinnipedialis]|uniref:Uncharacterized protein n=1 Tax=Phocicoccus pinnipedialis TaxID=110845 RepID=A0A6V7REY7_9BACL|nr:hypothetical protein [Jeotgalicoccus pinnipedialis]MBP1939389.1 hypothetical protein [Jeotgalicoccus pinnipedialis]CAD2075559.1 hypothetical protein JEOPIN946_01051 [Jeotgalicoccus pinnipedialis]